MLLQRLELAGCFQRAARTRELGLHHADITALEHLVVLGPLTPGELGRRLGRTSGGITALALRLEAAGWVRREMHADDRRMRLLSATPEGVACLEEHIRPVLEASDAALAGLGEEELALVGRALELLADAKHAAAEATPDPPREPLSDGYSRALLM